MKVKHPQKGESQKSNIHHRLWVFRLVTVTIIPFLFFLLLEMGLRVFGYGYSTHVMFENNVNGREGYSENIKFGWRFFSQNISREFIPFFFPAEKSSNTYRIFILGGSAAKGEQYEAFGFGRILKIMLQENYPDIQFEIINVAMAAINSHVVLEIIKDCVKYDPDLFIMYLGNNEIVGPYGAGTVFSSFSSNLTLIRLSMALKTFRIGQLFSNIIESINLSRNSPESWIGLGLFIDHQIRADHPRLGIVYQHFEKNLEDIIHTAQKNGTKIIISTVSCNLKDNPPFASLHRSDITEPERNKWEEIYKQGIIYEEAGKYIDAVESYLASAVVDDTFADLHYRLGHCYWAMGEYGRAQESYAKALQFDALRFRADEQINQIIHRVADERTTEGVYMVDSVKAFEEKSPYGIPGEEFLYDHVHMNFSGHYLLAKTLFDQVEKSLPERIKPQEASDYPILTEDECAQRLAYTDWDRYMIAHEILYNLFKNLPFTNQLYYTERIEKMEQTFNQLQTNLTQDVLQEAAAQYRQAIAEEPSDWWLHMNYAKLLSDGLNMDQMAYEDYNWALKLLPHSYQAYSSMGYVLGKEEKYDAAINCFKEALRIKPTSSQDHFFLGLAYQYQNKSEEAIKQYVETVQLQPIYGPAWVNLAVIQYEQGKIEKAIKTCRDGLQFNSDIFDLHYFLSNLLYQQRNRDEAIEELQAALKINPDSEEAQKTLEAILHNSL